MLIRFLCVQGNKFKIYINAKVNFNYFLKLFYLKFKHLDSIN